MTDKDFTWIAELLKLVVCKSNDGIDGCKRGDVERLRIALIWAHTAIDDAMYVVEKATGETV